MTTLVKADERHFTVQQIAEAWQFDEKTVRDLFRGEEGVIRLGNPTSTSRKRAYSTMRIPESVRQRVHRRMQVKG